MSLTATRAWDCVLGPLPAGRAIEFVCFDALSAPADWPRTPGGMRRGALGEPEILHIAPRRWLLPDPAEGLRAQAAAAEEAQTGTAVEVEGKWTSLELRGADAARVLSSTLDVAAVLESRDCAAVVLFDCPALIAALAAPVAGYRLFVKASYAAAFTAALNRAASALSDRTAGL
jgi:heterotetrameric sarcosine oxidase gamma subunit